MPRAKLQIISASRRTDIPAYYAQWFVNRLRAGYCVVPNPFNRNQVSRISLAPKDVLAIVFWTRNSRPLLPFLDELDHRDYRYYFQYTVMNNPRSIDPHGPSLHAALETFHSLANRIGADRVIWRYDPIIFTETTDAKFHQQTFETIADKLEGFTHRCVISVVDNYRKAQGRLRKLSRQEGFRLQGYVAEVHEPMLLALRKTAEERGMDLTSCAEDIDLSPLGIKPGKCVDDELIRRVFGVTVENRKDKSQREACGCVESRDIGVYDTCLMGCRYCYATSSFDKALANYKAHDNTGACLISGVKEPEEKREENPEQMNLF